MPEIEIPFVKKNVEHSWHLYVIKLNPERLSIDRNQFIEALREKGIGCLVHFIPLHIHLHPYYREIYGYHSESYLVASYIVLTNKDTVISAVKEAARA